MSTATLPAEQTLDQVRAKDAWDRIAALLKLSKHEQDDYAREAKKLPIRIREAGLGASLAFLAAKAKGDKKSLTTLLQDIGGFILDKRKIQPARSVGNEPKEFRLLAASIQEDSEFVRRVTDEALSWLTWLNRFAEAHGLPSDEGRD